MNRIYHITLAATGLLFSGMLSAQETSANELKLREALRSTMLQLRTVQTEQAELQAAHAQSEAKVSELSATLEKLTKQSADDQASSRKTAVDLTNKNETLEREVTRLEEALQKWKDGYAKAVEFARSKEADRSALADEKSVLQAKVRDHRAQNIELYSTATEILKRYEEFSTGRALSAREPFTGITRARLEVLVQDYKDEIEDRRIRPEPPQKKP